MLFETFCLFSCYNVKYVKKKAAVKKLLQKSQDKQILKKIVYWWHTIIFYTVYIYEYDYCRKMLQNLY